MTVIARVFLLFQLITVYPLITFMLRSQFFMAITGNVYPGLLHVLGFNIVIVTTCILFAIFFPSIGTIIRYVSSSDLVLSPVHYACTCISCMVQGIACHFVNASYTECLWACVYEHSFCTLRREQRREKVTADWRKLHSGKLYDVYCS